MNTQQTFRKVARKRLCGPNRTVQFSPRLQKFQAFVFTRVKTGKKKERSKKKGKATESLKMTKRLLNDEGARRDCGVCEIFQ